jgi:hypothetical protein
VQAGALETVLKPPTQSLHWRSLVAEPGALDDTLWPWAQVLHGAQGVPGRWSLSQVPGCGQVAPGLVPPGQYQPTAQSTQVGGIVGVPGAVCRCPDWQAFASRHSLAFSTVENLPVGQPSHWRSALVVPCAKTYEPGAQLRHSVHDAALLMVLNAPLAQLAQLRSRVLEAGGSITRWPALQLRCAVHVARFGEAVNVPAPQSAQLRSLLAVPGTLTYAPLAQTCQLAQSMALGVLLKVPLAQLLQTRLRVAVPGVLT